MAVLKGKDFAALDKNLPKIGLESEKFTINIITNGQHNFSNQ
jgi:hypothetical protein